MYQLAGLWSIFVRLIWIYFIDWHVFHPDKQMYLPDKYIRLDAAQIYFDQVYICWSEVHQTTFQIWKPPNTSAGHSSSLLNHTLLAALYNILIINGKTNGVQMIGSRYHKKRTHHKSTFNSLIIYGKTVSVQSIGWRSCRVKGKVFSFTPWSTPIWKVWEEV